MTGGAPEDVRRVVLSPRPKGRENAKDTLCRNVTIYGHCRYEDKGCAFNHDPVKVVAPQNPPESLKKRLNVDSPSFTPSSLAVNGYKPPTKSSGLSPKAANAAPFKPRGVSPGISLIGRTSAKSDTLAAATAPSFTPSMKQYNPNAPDWVAPEIPEFLPQSFNTISTNAENNIDPPHTSLYDQYSTNTPSIASSSHTPQPQINPYAQDSHSLGVPAYYQGVGGYTYPLQHHHYAALGPHREPLQANQRMARDFFIPEDLRQTLQKKSDATLATLPNSTLPTSIAHYHSLVPLVHSAQKNATLFGYPSWAYKAVSSADGRMYCLRRLQGYRLTNETTNEQAIRSVQQNWKRVRNGNIVTVFLAFTNSGFGDSSLIFVTDFHPLSETLAQKHFSPSSRFSNRNSSILISEQILWGYIVQIANALRALHSVGLAARIIDPSKILVTSGNRIRLNACAIMDVIQYDSTASLVELHCQDLYQFGRLILALGTNNLSASSNQTKATELFSRSYSVDLQESVAWLLGHISAEKSGNIDTFLARIASHVIGVFDSSLHTDDQLTSNLSSELENSRLVRLLTKLNFLNERPEYEHDRQWMEHGNRYVIQLFRDYVFHQVDAQGNPVLDLAHVLACCNKLDAGIDEKITLTARDENSVVIVSFRDIKGAIEAAWLDLTRRAG